MELSHSQINYLIYLANKHVSDSIDAGIIEDADIKTLTNEYQGDKQVMTNIIKDIIANSDFPIRANRFDYLSHNIHHYLILKKVQVNWGPRHDVISR